MQVSNDLVRPRPSFVHVDAPMSYDGIRIFSFTFVFFLDLVILWVVVVSLLRWVRHLHRDMACRDGYSKSNTIYGVGGKSARVSEPKICARHGHSRLSRAVAHRFR